MIILVICIYVNFSLNYYRFWVDDDDKKNTIESLCWFKWYVNGMEPLKINNSQTWAKHNVIRTACDSHLKTESNQPTSAMSEQTGKLQSLRHHSFEPCFRLLSLTRYTCFFVSPTNWLMRIILHRISLWFVTHCKKKRSFWV